MSWTDREILVCLLNVMEHSNCKLEYNDAPYPPGRNANGFRQKINALKRELQGEFKSIKAGNPIDSTTKPKGTPRKRKTAAAEGDSEESPKKKERAKKNAAFESKSEVQVKEEPEGEAEIEEDV